MFTPLYHPFVGKKGMVYHCWPLTLAPIEGNFDGEIDDNPLDFRGPLVGSTVWDSTLNTVGVITLCHLKSKFSLLIEPFYCMWVWSWFCQYRPNCITVYMYNITIIITIIIIIIIYIHIELYRYVICTYIAASSTRRCPLGSLHPTLGTTTTTATTTTTTGATTSAGLCSRSSEDCRSTGCCQDAGYTCALENCLWSDSIDTIGILWNLKELFMGFHRRISYRDLVNGIGIWWDSREFDRQR